MEDALDDSGFTLVNFVTCLLSVCGWDIHVAVGSPGENTDLAVLGFMEFAAPMAFDNLLAFVFSNHPLPLQQQLVCGRGRNLPIDEGDGDAELFELLDEHQLMGVFSSQ